MNKSSLARVFGPIIIRHSRPDRELEFSLKEVKKQHLVITQHILINKICFLLTVFIII